MGLLTHLLFALLHLINFRSVNAQLAEKEFIKDELNGTRRKMNNFTWTRFKFMLGVFVMVAFANRTKYSFAFYRARKLVWLMATATVRSVSMKLERETNIVTLKLKVGIICIRKFYCYKWTNFKVSDKANRN